MTPETHKPPRGAPPEHGAALILTLLVIVLLVVIVTGFLSTTRVEQIAARNYSFQSAGEQMAQLATRQAIAVLRSNYLTATSGIAFSTQPGAITVYQGGGSLSSRTLTNFSTGATATNLNALVTNGLITASASQAVNVGLVNVTSHAGAQLGRFAFYIDDDSTKLPVNAAVGDRGTINPVFPRPYSVRGLLGFGPATVGRFDDIVSGSAAGSSSISNWANFFSAEQVVSAFALDRTNLALISPAVETDVAYTTNTPWGSPKVFINALTLDSAGVSQIVSALTNSNLTRIFGQHFGNKYGPLTLQQLAANMLQLRDAGTGGVSLADLTNAFTSTNALLGAALPSDLYSGTNRANKLEGIPTSYLGYAPFPAISEVGLHALYGFTDTNRLTMRIVMSVELYNPFPANYSGGAQIVARMDKANFRLGTGISRGPEGTVSVENNSTNNNPWGNTNVPGGFNVTYSPSDVLRVPVPAISSGSYWKTTLNFETTFDETNTNAIPITSPVYAIIDQVRLLAVPGASNSIRDWISGDDMFDAVAPATNGARQIEITNPVRDGGANPSSPSAFTNAGVDPSVTFQRRDPRYRRPANVGINAPAINQLWFTNAPSFNRATNNELPAAATNNAIPGDRMFTNNLAQALWDTNLPPALVRSAAGSPTYYSSADLGKVFTGLPWRRIRLQPQPTNEATANLIPDWVMLDIFSTASPSVAVTPVNPNSTVLHQGGALARPSVALLSQMGVLTNAALMSQLRNPFISTDPQTNQPTIAGLVATNATRVNAIASNAATPGSIASWSSGSTWAARRSLPLRGFPTNVLLLPSEITEIAGVADYIAQTNNSAKLNEQRLGALLPGVQTKSRFFTIYALGEAFEGTNANAPVVSQRVLKTLVEVRTNSSPPSVDIVYQTPVQ
jgi:hypothetical protein